jgi:galactokinase/mevalonate kinase-like predicted kinase
MGQGLSIFIAFQVPSDTGLGSSTASGVALIQALRALDNDPFSPYELAELACRIEIERLGRPIGKQDSFTSSYGGLNYIEFTADGVTVDPISLPSDLNCALEARLMLFFTGRWQESARIWAEQRRNTQRNRATVIDALHDIKQAAVRLNQDLRRGEIAAVGECLHRSWLAKRQLAQGVSDPWIDQWYDSAINAGAKGGKLAGAGGGGFMLLYCEPDRQRNVTETLEGAGLSNVPFHFESVGVSVLLRHEAASQAPPLAGLARELPR